MRTSVLAGLVLLCALVGLALAGGPSQSELESSAAKEVIGRVSSKLGKKSDTPARVDESDESATSKKKKKATTGEPDEEIESESPMRETPIRPTVKVDDEEEASGLSSVECMDAIKEIPDMLGRGMFPWTPDNIPRMNLLRRIPKPVARSERAVHVDVESDLSVPSSGARRDCPVKSPTIFSEEEVARRKEYKLAYTTANALNSEMYDAKTDFLSQATNLAARAAIEVKFVPSIPHVLEFSTKASRLTDRFEFKNELIRHKEICQIALNDAGKRQLTDNFEWALQDLERQVLGESKHEAKNKGILDWKQRDALFEFFGEWGTHFVDSAVYGGSVIAYEYISNSTVGAEGSASIKLGEDYKFGGNAAKSHLSTSRRVEAKVIGGRLDDAKLLSDTFKAGAGKRDANVNRALGQWNAEITMDTAVPVVYHLKSICQLIGASTSPRIQHLAKICQLAHKEFLELEVDHEAKIGPMTETARRIEQLLDRFHSRGTVRLNQMTNEKIGTKLAKAIVAAKCHIHGCVHHTDGLPDHKPALFYIDVLRLQGSIFEVMLLNYQNLVWEAEQVLASELLGDYAMIINEKRVPTTGTLAPNLKALGIKYNLNMYRYLNMYSSNVEDKKIPFHKKLEDTYTETKSEL